MEDDFEREFADELSMIQDEGDLSNKNKYKSIAAMGLRGLKLPTILTTKML